MNVRRSCVTVLVLIFTVFDVVLGNNCCPHDNLYLRKKRICSQRDDENEEFATPNINCSNIGKYIVDPTTDKLDNFIILEDGHLQIGDNYSSYMVPPHKYCVTNIYADEGESGEKINVAFVCFPGEEDEIRGRTEGVQSYFAVLLLISVIFLFLTLITYILLPELRDLQGRCIMPTVLSQMLAYTALAVLQFRGHIMEDTLCVFSAFFLYFWMLSAFFWLNVASFNVWRTVQFQRFHISDNRLYYGYSMYGWGFPGLCLSIAIITHHSPITDESLLRPNFALSNCWFHDAPETWAYFYGPISILLAMNLVFFILTVFRLWRLSSRGTTVPGLRSSRFKCILYLKLFMLMGILWIFEVLSYFVNVEGGIWNFTDTINSLQGVLIFLVVVCRKRVLHALSKREWGASITSFCPKCCISGPDEEQEEAMLPDCAGDEETDVAMDAPSRGRT